MQRETLTQQDWAPLPKRKKQSSRSDKQVTSMSNVERVEENISLRKASQSLRCVATLESKDGCEGEFYEYLDHPADVQLHS